MLHQALKVELEEETNNETPVFFIRFFSHCNHSPLSLNFIIGRTRLSHYYCLGIPAKMILLAVNGRGANISLAGAISC